MVFDKHQYETAYKNQTAFRMYCADLSVLLTSHRRNVGQAFAAEVFDSGSGCAHPGGLISCVESLTSHEAREMLSQEVRATHDFPVIEMPLVCISTSNRRREGFG